MTKTVHDHVRPTMPTVTLRGVKHELKPLSASMAYDFLPILEQGVNAFAHVEAGNVTQTQLMVHMLGLVRKNRKVFDDVFAHVLGVKPKDFNDGERFPIGTHLKLVQALGEHPDLVDFLSDARGLWTTMPGADETDSREPSESSEPPEGTQDGVTKAS